VKNFLIRILLAAALTLVAFALVSSAQAQQADEDRAPATPRQQQPAETPKSPRQPQVPAPSGDAQTNDAQTQQAIAFTGRIAIEEGKLVLKDPVTKMSYQLNDQSKAKPYVGKQVKVVGKLEMKSNTIHIDTIEPI
jgi:hemolysin activation/secretion protein